LTWDPKENFALYTHGFQHTDHRAAGAISVQTAYPTARDWLFFPEQILEDGLDVWKVAQVWLFSWEMDPLDQAATMKIDITPFVDLKIKALLQHKSQISDPNEAAKSVRDVASALGGASGIQYAEWYTRVLML
jgi:LmbE family N-acetylglucosaminyl deacetylase